MAQWHPVDSLLPAKLIFPRPGRKEPYAIFRWVDVMLEGEPASRWRVVTWHSDPKRRRLIGAGYYRELEKAAMAAHRHAVGNAGSNIIQTAGASIGMSPERAVYR